MNIECCGTCLYCKTKFYGKYCVAKDIRVNLFSNPCVYYLPDYVKLRGNKSCVNTVMGNLQKI